MKITSAEFVRSTFDRSHWLNDGGPEIAFLGRSNVGKSSLINSLLGRRGLARTSNTPGRTQSINFFLINDRFYFADLPGYGYAKVSKTMRADWGKMAEEYLSGREELVLCVQLVDARHEPSKLDQQLNDWLRHYRKPHIVTATKSDKLSRNELQRSLNVIKRTFADSDVIAYSSQTSAGRDELWSRILEAISSEAKN
jgi:GTP-binding protein